MCESKNSYPFAAQNPTDSDKCFHKTECGEEVKTKEPRINFSKFHQLILALLRTRVRADVFNDSLSCCVWNVWTIDVRPYISFISVKIISCQTDFQTNVSWNFSFGFENGFCDCVKVNLKGKMSTAATKGRTVATSVEGYLKKFCLLENAKIK